MSAYLTAVLPRPGKQDDISISAYTVQSDNIRLWRVGVTP